MIRPRLPRIRPAASGIALTLSELNDPKSPAATYGIGPPDPTSARLGLDTGHNGGLDTNLGPTVAPPWQFLGVKE